MSLNSGQELVDLAANGELRRVKSHAEAISDEVKNNDLAQHHSLIDVFCS